MRGGPDPYTLCPDSDTASRSGVRPRASLATMLKSMLRKPVPVDVGPDPGTDRTVPREDKLPLDSPRNSSGDQ